jgi:hypothetical protein
MLYVGDGVMWTLTVREHTTVRVEYFRKRRMGPELDLENILAEQLPDLFDHLNYPRWTAGSLPIGAGAPDLTVVACEPQVAGLTRTRQPDIHILAYLRTVRWARLETVQEKVRRPEEAVRECLNSLLEVGAISELSGTFSLVPIWRSILPSVTTIEVKVSDWRRAVAQANRNRIFAHQSFVALPESLADRVLREPVFSHLGIGVMSIGPQGKVVIHRRARKHRPRVWSYYYRLASLSADFCAV